MKCQIEKTAHNKNADGFCQSQIPTYCAIRLHEYSFANQILCLGRLSLLALTRRDLENSWNDNCNSQGWTHTQDTESPGKKHMPFPSRHEFHLQWCARRKTDSLESMDIHLATFQKGFANLWKLQSVVQVFVLRLHLEQKLRRQ